MESHDITVYEVPRRGPATIKEVLLILFRHGRLICVVFFGILAGAVLAIFLLGIKYRAQTTILVRNERQNQVVSSGSQSPRFTQTDQARQREIDTAVAMLKSEDLLEQVAQQSHLVSSVHRPWSRWLNPQEDGNSALAKAAHSLGKKLHVAEIRDSNLIQVTYTSRNPKQAALVLKNLDRLYIARHVAVYRPPEIVTFFAKQTQHYKDRLEQAENKLAAFDSSQNAASPDIERGIELKQESQFEGQLKEAEAEIAQTRQRNQVLRAELSKTPQRLTTKHTLSGNAQLMANLKSTLQNLENKRAVLLTNYQPTYRPVQEVEKQIAQVKAAIFTAEKAPLQQTTTDLNPTYQMLQSDLDSGEASLRALQRKEIALSPIAQSYGKAALVADRQGIERENLTRAVKADQQNYLLYLHKREQARISEAMDNQRILNVAVAEAPIVPSLPTSSPLTLAMAAVILAGMLSIGSAFVADYGDPSFRTPDEVARYLEIPVLAALPKSGRPTRHTLAPIKSDDDSGTSSSDNNKHKFFFRPGRNGHRE